MAKALEINAKQIADAIRHLANNSERELESIVAYGAKQMAKKAQRIFNRAEYDGTNDVYCYSVKATTDTNALCTYNVVAYSPSGSVAFIEFGTGYDLNVNREPFFTEAQPPMVKWGYYGKGMGMLPYWVFKQKGAITKPTWNLFPVYDPKTGGYKEDVWWTKGNRPARAMWGAKLEFDKKLSYWADMVGGKK